MRKLILNMAIAIVAGVVFVSCEKNDDDIFLTETIEIEIDSDGGEYTFASNTVEVILPPNEFNAEVVNNTIVGNYAGQTKATIKSGNTTYECNINVSPSYTYYVDMIIYMGWTKSQIEELYGTAKRVSKSTYYYEPLSAYLPEDEVAFSYDDSGKVIICASYFTIYQMSSVIKHLQQRYATYGLSNNNGYYGNALEMEDATVVIMCGIESGIVAYTDASIVE